MSRRKVSLVLVASLLVGILLLSSAVLAQEKINIRFPVWASAPFHRATLTPHIMRFNKAHPNVYVDIKYMSWEEINKMVQRAGIIGKLDAEVIQAESNHAIALAVNGFAEPLNDFLTDPWNQYLYEQTPENVWNAWTYEGEIIGWAYNMHGGIIIYNTKVAEKYGVNPKDIVSWDDFTKVAQKFTVDSNGDGQTDVWGFVPNLQQPNTAYREVLANLAVGNGGEFLVEENGKYYSRVAGENVIQAAQYLSDLRHEYKVIPPEVMGFDRKGMVKAAGDEKVGFTQVMAALGVYFGKEGWFEGVDWQYGLRAIPWPVGPQGTESAYGGAFGGWVINERRSEEVKDAAKELLRHMIHEAYKGALMGNRPVYSWGLEVYKLMGPIFRDVAEITEKYIFSVQLPIPEGRSVQEMIGRRVQELFAKTEVTNISEVWENLDQEITTVLKESGHQ